ncbi:hypothetical protein D3C86_1115610 [compost metagenome]
MFLCARPVRFSSIAVATTAKVLPAPTTWSSSAVRSCTPRAIALRWWRRNLMTSSGTLPGKVIMAPS